MYIILENPIEEFMQNLTHIFFNITLIAISITQERTGRERHSLDLETTSLNT